MKSSNHSELAQKAGLWSKLAKSNIGSLFSVNDECISKESAAPSPSLQPAGHSLNTTDAAKITFYSERKELYEVCNEQHCGKQMRNPGKDTNHTSRGENVARRKGKIKLKQ